MTTRDRTRFDRQPHEPPDRWWYGYVLANL
jgi:hypothetical protein